MTTNYERIKNMSIEEMAELLDQNGFGCRYCSHKNDLKVDCFNTDDDICRLGRLKFLQQEAQDE